MGFSAQFKGRFKGGLPQKTGEGKNGTWVVQEFIIEEIEKNDYSRPIVFTAFGTEKIALMAAFAMNQIIEVNLNVSSSDYNGRWYPKLDLWKASAVSAAPQTQAAAPPTIPTATPPTVATPPSVATPPTVAADPAAYKDKRVNDVDGVEWWSNGVQWHKAEGGQFIPSTGAPQLSDLPF